MKQSTKNYKTKSIIGIWMFCVLLSGCKDPETQVIIERKISDNEIFEAIIEISDGRLQKLENNDFRFELYQDQFSEEIKNAISTRNTFKLEESILIPKEKAEAIFCLTDDNYCLVENDFILPEGQYPLELINPFGQRACDTFSWWYDVDGHKVNTYFTLCY